MNPSADRRTFLKVLGGAAASAFASVPVFTALADPAPAGENEFFVFVHASGAWDVTLWSDPRNVDVGLVDAATEDRVETTGLTRWRTRTGTTSFEPVRPSGSNITFGPAIGDLADLYDRLTVINGIAMNTVSHPDGTAFSSTGRHLAGGRMVAASIDTMVANEFGRERLFPSISVNFPSAFAGPNLDARATPLRVGSIGTVARSLARSEAFDTAADREAVTVLLSRESADLAQRAYYPEAWRGLSQQYTGLQQMLNSRLQSSFDAAALQRAYPEFDYAGRFFPNSAINAAFAVEAMRRNVVRSLSFSVGSFDTHGANYEEHGLRQQELFNLVSDLVRKLDLTDHPTLPREKLGAHTHILVFSEFCRTPQINIGGGRDHYPNNSALVISPRFRGNFTYGSTDTRELLPQPSGRFSDGMRAIAPPDLLATFVSAFGVDPRKYMRDGEVVRELLRP